MLGRILDFFRKNAFFLIMVMIISFIVARNYERGTWLSGWDTLHPEFNLSLALNREFAGVWRSEMGLGNLVGHSDISELPRILILKTFSFFLKPELLRYSYIFLGLFLGPLGLYIFLNKFLPENHRYTRAASFLGSCYYLLNFATLQHFYVPLEMFVALYAGLPWIFYFSLKYINKIENNSLIWLFAVSLIAAPMAWAATLFYAYLFCFVVFLFINLFITDERRSKFLRSLTAIGVIIAANSFWLIPNIYSIAKEGGTVMSSRINLLFSEEAFISNRAYGDIGNVLINKNHLFSWQEYDSKNNQFKYLLDEWLTHLDKPLINLSLYMVVFFVLSGLLVAVIKKDRIGLTFLLPTLVALFFLINENPPSGFIYLYLRQNISVFEEGLRMPFTKFSIPFIFFFSFYLSYFFIFFGNFIKKYLVFPVILFFLILTVIFYPMLPAFKGNLISPSLKINIPDEYFKFFELMRGKEGRIAKFPLHTPFGWTYYDWGFQGSSFTQFGLENPVLDRDYDRWSAENETFYNQASFALYSEDLELLERTLERFNVAYLLIDNSVVSLNTGNNLFLQETKNLFEKSEKISLMKKVGFLEIYSFNKTWDKDVYAPSFYTQVNAKLTYSEIDYIFEKLGFYVFDAENSNFYPFVNFDHRSGLSVDHIEDRLVIRKDFERERYIEEVAIKSIVSLEKYIYADVFAELKGDSLDLIFRYYEPNISLGSKIYPVGNVNLLKDLLLKQFLVL